MREVQPPFSRQANLTSPFLSKPSGSRHRHRIDKSPEKPASSCVPYACICPIWWMSLGVRFILELVPFSKTPAQMPIVS